MSARDGGRLTGLPPIVGARPRLLILGSMPGAASLVEARYYAHPRNAFWPVMAALVGFDPTCDYPARLAALGTAGIALWDVIGACRRRGSLDAAIDPRSIVVNPISGLLAAHRSIACVATNGSTASALYRRHVLPALGANAPAHIALPSTSPAHAGLSLASKTAAWTGALAAFTSEFGGAPH